MIVSGADFTEAKPAMPPIKPQMVGAGVAYLTVRGTCDFCFTETGLEFACSNLRKDPEVRSIVLHIDSDLTTVNPADLMELVHRLNQAKPVFAFVDVAVGGAFLLALPSRAIVAHPQAAIGRLGARVVDGLDDDHLHDAAETLNAQISDTVALFRPSIEPRLVQRLMEHEIRGGEVLEHFGIVDMVMPLARLVASLGGSTR